MSTKTSNDTIGDRTRDLPACSAAPPGAPVSVPIRVINSYIFCFSWPLYPTVDIRDGVICGELFKLWNSHPVARGIQNAVL